MEQSAAKSQVLQAERELAKALERAFEVDEVRRQWFTRMVQIKNRLGMLGG